MTNIMLRLLLLALACIATSFEDVVISVDARSINKVHTSSLKVEDTSSGEDGDDDDDDDDSDENG